MAAEYRGPHISRRQLVQGAGAVGLGLLAGCGRWPGQAAPGKIHRIGWLAPSVPGSLTAQAFLQGMRELDYEEGRNLTIEWRAFDGRNEGLVEQMAELIHGQPSVLVTGSNFPALAAKRATSTIPIVFVSVSDPVGEGLVASLARPGGNATGLSNLATGLAAKRLELLKAMAPDVSRVAVFWLAAGGRPNLQLREVQEAAEALGIEVLSLEVGAIGDVDSALQATARERADALYLTANPFITPARTPQVYEFAAKHRLPLVGAWRSDAESGGLLAYGISTPPLFRRAAAYVDKILKGTNPADLPVEQPMVFDLVINLKAAQALGLTIPPHVLLQATEVIQ